MNQNSKLINLYYFNQLTEEEQKELKDERRKKTPRFVDKFELDTIESETIILFKLANDLRHFGNELTYWLNNNYRQMIRTKQYHNSMIQYKKYKNKLKGLNEKKNKKEYDYWNNKLEKTQLELENLRKRFQLTWENLRKKQIELGNTEQYEYIHSHFKLTKAEDIWHGMQTILYGNGKKLNYKQSNNLPIIQAKQLERGITANFDKNDNLIIGIGFSRKSTIKSLKLKLKPIKENDLFLQDEYSLIYKFLRNTEEMEYNALELYAKNGGLMDIHRICYFSIKCEIIRGRKRIFLMPTMEGIPSTKKKIIKNSNGTTTITKRHHFYNGKEKRRVGFDEGTQSYAFVTKNKIDLDNIGERNRTIIKTNERKEQLLSSSLGRSRMINNSQNYNDNGKLIKGKKTWYKSKNYRKKQQKHKELCRANALSRKYAIHELVNKVRTYANELVIEPSNFNALKKKTKESKKTNKTIDITTKNGETISIKKKSKRKRFGKSINRRSPGYLHERLREVFVRTGGTCIIVTNTVKASQYDHELDNFIKKKLSQRFHIFSDGTKVQRDIYSAFLLYCVNDIGTKIDRERCLEFFNQFYMMFLKLEDEIKSTRRQVCNSGYKFK